MILHLIANAHFIENIVGQFEAVAPDRHRYVFLTKKKEETINYFFREKVEIMVKGDDNYKDLLGSLYNYEAIILHSLHSQFYEIVLAAPSDMKIVWMIFGADFYSNFLGLTKKLMLPGTKKYYKLSGDNLIDILKPLYRKLIGKPTNYEYVKRCLPKIKYCALAQKKTYKELMDTGLTKAEYIDFSYYSLEDTIGEYLLNKTVTGENILIGNNAAITNNHLDSFQLIRGIALNGKKVIVPLSYGENPLLNRIIRTGKKMFDENFVPLLNFMPRQEYNEVLLSCGFVIMNQLRPQGRGNILTALWLGAKVFLDERNVFYEDFLSKGLFIFSTSLITSNREEAFVKLTEEEIRHNREILKKEYGRNQVLKKCKNLVDIVAER